MFDYIFLFIFCLSVLTFLYFILFQFLLIFKLIFFMLFHFCFAFLFFMLFYFLLVFVYIFIFLVFCLIMFFYFFCFTYFLFYCKQQRALKNKKVTELVTFLLKQCFDRSILDVIYQSPLPPRPPRKIPSSFLAISVISLTAVLPRLAISLRLRIASFPLDPAEYISAVA